MMKKFLALALSATLVLSFAACGSKDEKESNILADVLEAMSSSGASHGSNDSDDSGRTHSSSSSRESNSSRESDASAATPTPEPTPTPSPTPAPSSYRLTAANGFSNGLAFVTFYDGTSGKSYGGFIDTSGKLRNYVESDNVSGSKGYLYINKNNGFMVITPDGKTTAYELSDDLRVMVYGDGYVVIEEHKAGFEAVEYVYHIYDGTGKELSSYSSGSVQVSNLRYVGEGTFLFTPQHVWSNDQYAYGYSVQYADLYFAGSNTWLQEQLVANTSSGEGVRSFSYQDDVFMFRGGSYSNDSRNIHRGEFTYANSKGELQTITVPAEYGTNPMYLRNAGGMMLFKNDYSSQFAVYYYDIATGNWSSYQGQYTDRLYSGQNPVAGEGYIAICLRGADGAYYTMLLDKNMAEVLDAPIPGIPSSIRDGVLYTTDSSGSSKRILYDLKGKQLAEISNVKAYTEGIIVTSQQEFLKTDGTPAFSEVDFSTGRLITLP